MEKFWIYLSVWLIGFAGGVILGVIIDKDTVYRGIFKIKQRGNGNIQQPNLNMDMSRKTRRQERKEKRLQRRIDKVKKNT